MMRKLRVWLSVICLCTGLFTVMNVSAETLYVYDHADLLTIEEEEELQNYAEVMKDTWKMNFLIITTDDARGKSSMNMQMIFMMHSFRKSQKWMEWHI